MTSVAPKRPQSNELRMRALKIVTCMGSDKAISFLASGNFHAPLRNSPFLGYVRDKYYFL